MPSLWNLDPFIAAGIDPKTGLPIKIGSGSPCVVQPDDFLRQLRVVDEQNALQRFTWYNLPDGLTGELIERVLYYKGAGMFCKLPDDKFYFLPFALDGSIDVYGRFESITPLPFNGTTGNKGEAEPLIKGLTYKVFHEIQMPEDYISEDGSFDVPKMDEAVNRGAVIIRDYSEQISQTVLPRQMLNEPILRVMAECPLLMRTALYNSTGVSGLRVGDQTEASNAAAASESVNRASLQGQRYIPIVGQLDFQDLAAGNIAKAEEFMLAMQSLDNYRLSLFGLENGGLFQKHSHILQAEQDVNTGNTGFVLRDSLMKRQNACNIINSIHGLGIWCEPSEPVLGYDRDGDGTMGSNEDQGTNGRSTAPEEGGTQDE